MPSPVRRARARPTPRPAPGAFALIFAASAAFAAPAPAISAAAIAAAPAQQGHEEAEPSAPDTARAARAGLPLEPGRTLAFTAERGTWMSLDVSPDGRTIVFDLLGDLYTIPFEGGAAHHLTSGMSLDVQPRFSPDGSRVLFVSDRDGAENLWTIALDGRDTVQLTKGKSHIYTSPEWSPDGSYVVASRTHGLGGSAKLWMFHVEGGSGIQLIREPDNLKTLGAAFGPDPRYVWHARRTGDWQYNAILPQYQLAVLDLETGRSSVMSGRYGSAFRPALSPDGRWLAYGTRWEDGTGLRVRELATGEERWLAYPVQRDDQEARATLDVLPGYAFTPDSREVVVSFDGQIWRVPIDGSPPIRVPFRAEVTLELGPEVRFAHRVDDAPRFHAREIRDGVPSPDGRRLAFTAADALYVSDLPGGMPRPVADGVEGGHFHPAWSPEGRWLVFANWSDADGGHLWRVSADGRGRAQRLTTVAALYQQPAWSPDGERVVAVRGDARDMREGVATFRGGLGSELVWVPAGGGEARVIAPAGGRSSPHFSRNPERIFAHSNSEGLVSMRWDGTDERTHLQVTGATMAGASRPGTASVILVGPGEDLALAQIETDVYLVTVPMVGGETPTVSVTDADRAAVPIRRISGVGGQFPAWRADGRAAHWSLGTAHFAYDIEGALTRAALRSASDRPDPEGAADETGAGSGDGAPEPEDPRLTEHRVEVVLERDIPHGALVLRGGRVITMVEDDVIEDADIVVQDGRILGVGARGTVEVPEGAGIRDISGATVVPGFVDTHAHLRPGFGVHPNQTWQYLANLAYGVTTTRDPQTGTTDVLTYSDLVESGRMLGPRIYSTGPGVFGTYRGEAVKDLDHARRTLRRYSEYFDTKTFKMYLAGNREQRQWLVMAARELGLMPTTEAGIDFALDLTHAMDGYPGIEHNLPIFPIYDDVVRLFASTGVTYSPTLLVSFGGPFAENYWYAREDVYGNAKLRRFTPLSELQSKARRRGNNPGPGGWFMDEEHVFPHHAAFVHDLVAAGGRVGVGSHGQLQGLGYHWELWSMQSGGLSAHDALRAATIFGAEGIGLGTDLGSVQPGKLADLVVLERNPLDDIRNSEAIRYVMKNGRLYDASTLHELWPRRRSLPAGPWQEGAPATAAGITPAP